MKKRIEGVTVYGIDIGKNTFHVVGLDSVGKPDDWVSKELEPAIVCCKSDSSRGCRITLYPSRHCSRD